MIPLSDLVEWEAARTVASPNHNSRVGTTNILGVVLHATAGSDEGSESWMANPAAEVSCHVHIRRDGSTTRMVSDTRRAWHAGRSEWRGSEDVNSITLGWEIGNMNNGVEQYTDLQYGVLAQMAAHYIRQGLTLDDFVSHAEVARPVGRKDDPRGFDWARFRNETLRRMGVPAIMVSLYDTDNCFGLRVYSEFLGENLIVVRYVNDREWYYVRESDINPVRAQSPLSAMAEARS